ncbi:hypothetical protein IFR04_012613 [Cadophora malorum]|uniref:Uncharacterized protein n=1 Tax=Cadophora malorum TaxID=108018 RepID=A0A8H7T767_9HELO|nr:hypothetical protein IFR04_012613 [Cadophora malorum]
MAQIRFSDTLSISNNSTSDSNLPKLDYDLYTKKWSIIFFCSCAALDSVAVPIVLYIILNYETDLDKDTVYLIISGTLFGTIIVEFLQRTWRLWKKSSTCRVANTGRWDFDWFHWNSALVLIIIIAEVAIATSLDTPQVRLLAMPTSSILFVVSIEVLLIELMRAFRVRAPFRVSSVTKGEYLRPALFTLIEDVVAVDGNGGSGYRVRLNARYETSKDFRRLLLFMTWFWTVPCLLVAVATSAVVFWPHLLHRDLAYINRIPSDFQQDSLRDLRASEYKNSYIWKLVLKSLPSYLVHLSQNVLLLRRSKEAADNDRKERGIQFNDYLETLQDSTCNDERLVNIDLDFSALLPTQYHLLQAALDVRGDVIDGSSRLQVLPRPVDTGTQFCNSATLLVSIMKSATFVLASLAAFAGWCAVAGVTGLAPGFAKGTIGGGNAVGTYPKDIAQLKTWLTDSTPRVILLNKEYNFIGSEGKVTEQGCRPAFNKCQKLVSVTYDKAGVAGINLGSNKSIVGVGANAVIRGKGLRIANGAKNIII